MKLSQNVRKLIAYINKQDQIKDMGYFRDEVDNINGLEEGLRHLTENECKQLAQLKGEAKYRDKILEVALASSLISPTIRSQIVEALQ